MTVSIIVPYFNLPEFLHRLLDDLPKQSYPHGLIEVVIVDDGSPEPAKPVVAQHSAHLSDFRALRVLRHSANRGRAAARNTGIRASSGDIIAFVDVDDLPGRDFVARIVELHSLCPHIAVRSNVRVLPELRSSSAFLRFRDSRYLGGRKRPCRTGIDLFNLPPNFFATSGMSVLRSDLVAAGLFDESYHGYGGEDEELGFRLFANGVRIVFDAACEYWDADYTNTLDRTCARYRDYGEHAARVLFSTWPDYRRFSRLSKLEPIHVPPDSTLEVAQKAALRLVLRPSIGRFLRRVLSLVDRCCLPFDPPGVVYQYVLLCSYLEGVLARQRPKHPPVAGERYDRATPGGP